MERKIRDDARYSQECIVDAFIFLLGEKNFQDITVTELCKKAGVVLTPAGSTFPYKNDPEDKNLRIAPSYPTVEDMEKAMEVLCLCVKIAAAEKAEA